MVSCIISKVIKGNYLTFLKIKCCAYVYNLLHHFLKVIMTFKWSLWYIYIYVGTSFPFLCFFVSLKKNKNKKNLRSLIILQSLLKVDKLLLLPMPTISIIAVKLLFTTICFVGFYFVPNLIVIIFNPVYHVCIVGFHCKGWVIERVVWRLNHLKTKEGSAGISRLSIPQSISCALHVLKCEESGQMETAVSREYLVGKAVETKKNVP